MESERLSDDGDEKGTSSKAYWNELPGGRGCPRSGEVAQSLGKHVACPGRGSRREPSSTEAGDKGIHVLLTCVFTVECELGGAVGSGQAPIRLRESLCDCH